MADRIRQTQRHTQNLIDSSIKRDVLFPTTGQSISAPLASEFKYIGSINQAQLGDIVTFDIPKMNYLSELVVEFNLGTNTSGNWCEYPALSIISEVILNSQSGNELHQYRYNPVMQAILARLPDASERTILQASGGTAFTSGRCVAPIPYFGSMLAHREQAVPPMPNHIVQGKLRLELRLRNGADCLASGSSGAGTINMRLWYLHYNVDSTLRNQHFNNRGAYKLKSIDWQTNENNAITASSPASSNFDLSGLHGSLHTLAIMAKSTTDKTTNNLYYELGSVVDLKVRADGDTLYDVDSRNAQLLFSYLHDKTYPSSTFTDGEVVTVSFGYNDPMGKSSNYGGSIHMNDVNDFRVEEVDAVETGVIDFVGEFDVHYVINGAGDIKRLR